MTKLLLSILTSTFFASLISLVDARIELVFLVDGTPEYANIEEGGQCSGSATGTIVYGDGEVVKLVLHAGRDLVSSSVVTRFNFTNRFLPATTVQQSQYGGENGMTIEDDGHEIFLFPGGYSGQQVVHAYNYSDNSSSIIEVHCPPRSLVRQQRAGDTIVGHCKRTPYTQHITVNTSTSNSVC